MIETDTGCNQTVVLAKLMPISTVLWKAGCWLYFLLNQIGSAKRDGLHLGLCVTEIGCNVNSLKAMYMETADMKQIRMMAMHIKVTVYVEVSSYADIF